MKRIPQKPTLASPSNTGSLFAPTRRPAVVDAANSTDLATALHHVRTCRGERVSLDQATHAARMLAWTQRYEPDRDLGDMGIEWMRVLAALTAAGLDPLAYLPARQGVTRA